MKKLVLAEKPSVARDLAFILGATKQNKNYFEGEKYIVTWALGHLLTLQMPEDLNKNWQKWALETLPMIPKKIGTKPLPKTRKQLQVIEKLTQRKDVSQVIIATDAGREGELVARWILNYVRFNKSIMRLWISSQTKKAVKEGFSNLKPSKNYDNLYNAAIGRSKADWLIGLNVTRALSVKYQDNLSAGRVQTPTLALVRKQEEKIERFVPQKYYVISLNYKNKESSLKQSALITDKNLAQEIVSKLSKNIGEVTNIEVKQKSQFAPLPYDLTELQKDANLIFGYSAKKTLSLVQSLYEVHKVVSYPRTDSRYLSSDIKLTMKERLQAVSKNFLVAKEIIKNGGKVILKKVFNDQKVSDHYALIPTEQAPNYLKFSNDEQRIYNLIVKRFLGLFLPPYKTEEKKIAVKFGLEEFNFKESTVVEKGWQDLKKSSTQINWKIGDKIKPNFKIKEKLTVAPKPVNEGILLSLMEKYGLGTPATRAEIIEKLIRTDLMERSSSLKVTQKGKQLLKLVNPKLVTPTLTAKWESKLEDIAKGRYELNNFLKEIKNDVKQLVSEVKSSQQKYHDFSITQKRCPKCDSLLREKNSRDGKLLICTNQECDYKRWAEAKESNHRCSKCHRKMIIISGKNGNYFRCKYDGTTEKIQSKKTNNKMTRREERRLLKKVNQKEDDESALAIALKQAMKDK